MHTPTTDQTDRHDPGPCRCSAYVLCPKCARDLQRFRHEQEMRAWVETFGSPMWQGRRWGMA